MSKNYTIAEVAEKVRVSERTILREIKRGKLKTNKAGRRYLITQSQLDDYLGKGEPDVSLAIDTYLHEKKSEMTAMVQHLVSYGDDLDGVEKSATYLKSKLMKYGFRVHMHRGSHSIVRVSYGYREKGILFRAPLDSFPVGDPTGWKHAPFEGVVKNDRMYGRGVLDGISGIVAVIFMLRALKKYVSEDDIRVEAVFDSGVVEGDFDSIVDLVSRGISASIGINCVGDVQGSIGLGSKGIWHGILSSRGDASIASIARTIRDLDNNAVEFTSLAGGTSAENSDTCKAGFILRTDGTLGRSAAKELVLKRVRLDDVSVSLLSGYSGYQIDKDNPFVLSVATSAKAKGVPKPTYDIREQGSGAGIYAGHGIPLIHLGPSGGNSRSYDEYVELNSIPQTAALYADTAARYAA